MKKEIVRDNLLKFLKESHGIISYACNKVGCSRKAFYQWYNEDKEFKQEVDEIKEETIDVVESKLLSKINEGDLTAILFYLKTQGKNRGYVEKSEHEVSVNAFEELMKSLPED